MMNDKWKSKKQLIAELQELRDQLGRAHDFGPSPERKVESSATEAHTGEPLFHSLVESMPQSVLCKDLEGRIIFANQRFCTLEGKSLDEILGKTDFDLYSPELAQKYRNDDQQVIQSGDTIDIVEAHQSPGREETFYVQVIKTPVYDFQDRITGVLVTFWDVTTLRRAEKELLKVEKLKSLGILAGGIAHDFNKIP